MAERALDLDPCRALLVRLCRRDAASLGPADLRQLADAEFHARFHEVAAQHRVHGLVLTTLEREPLARELAPETLAALLQPLAELRARADAQERELARLLEHFRLAGLDPVVLKGPALRRTVYSEPVERRFGDFDLLFAPEELDRAFATAESAGYCFQSSARRLAGYRADHFHVILRRPERFVVELHWGLSRLTWPFRLEPRDFLQGSRPVGPARAGEIELRIPRPELMLLHMAHENLRDSFSRLVRLVDVDRIVAVAPGIDWDEVAALARRGGLGPLVALSLELAREILGTPIPTRAVQGLRARGLARVHIGLMRPASSLLHRRLGGPGARTSLRLWLTLGARARIAQLARLASGRQHAEEWIFRWTEDGPPGAVKSLWEGSKLCVRILGYHAGLYANLPLSWLSFGRLRIAPRPHRTRSPRPSDVRLEQTS